MLTQVASSPGPRRNYGSTKSEFLGVVWAFKHFRCYLLGKRFLVRTDHKALKYWRKFKDPSAIIARWMEFLSQFDFDVQYRQGRAHANADGLSRQGCAPAPEHDELDDMHALYCVTPGVIPNAHACDASCPRGHTVHVATVSTCDSYQYLPRLYNVQIGRWINWRDAQEDDEELLLFRSWLDLHPPLTLPRLTGTSPALQKYWRGRQCFRVREGVLCRMWEEEDSSRPTRFQILVPVKLRARMLEEYHDQAGHQGIHRTYCQLLKRFYWHGMKRDVHDYVASCKSCSQRSRPVGRGKGAPLQVTWSGYPFERIAMDLIPGLPETINGNKHILVVVDYFSKWVEAYPLKRMDAATIASVFVSEFVSRFGAPESLHTDQGKNFDSKLFKDVCLLLGIKKTRTTAYHPSGDGLVERFNQTLERLLSHYVADHQRDWDVQLPAMLMAYRATPQSSTGYTPAYLLFGKELCLPQDIAYGLPAEEIACASQPAYVKDLRQRLAHAHTIVRRKLAAVHQHQAHFHDAGAVAVSFNTGDLVWLLVPAIPVGTTPKFSKLWKGPFVVVKELSSVTYRIRDESNGKEQVVHVNRLKKCHTRPERLESIEEAPQAERVEGFAAESAATTRSQGYIRDATDWLYADDEDLAREAYGGLDAVPGVPVVPPQQINAGIATAPPHHRVARRRRPPAHLQQYVWGYQ